MTDMRRTLLWVVFSMSLFLIYDAWQKHNGHPSFFSPVPAKVAAPAASAAGGLPTPTAANPATGATAAAPGAPAGAAPTVAERTTITTDVVKATLSGAGGTLTRVELLKYPDHVLKEWYDPLLELFGKKAAAAAPKDVVLLDESPERLYVAESGLIPAAGGSGLPNHHTVMTLVPGERTLAAGQNTLQVKFESPVVGGVKLVKTYTFKRGDYVIDVKNEVVNESGAAVSPRLYLQLVRDGVPPPGESSVYSTFTGPAVDDGNKFQKVDFKSIEKRTPTDKPDHTTESDSGWVAMVQHYFTSAWLIDKADGSKQPREYFTGKTDMTNPSTGQSARVYSVGMFVPLGEIAPGATKAFDAKLFVGPQEEEKLAKLAPRLELVKDYGIFKILAEPLFWLLTQLHKVIGNWGWSIVGLVVLLKIAFYWLNAKAYGSMAKMKAISPKITAMRERLKDKPQEMQQEMMRIYREEKINPLGGCLPIFVQMPFFISLYWVLLSTVEMRGAPWIGWITDLSAKDPYFILPILMTLTSLLQTWLNPTPPDPVQAKMMWFMPLIFSVMFFVFPSGLVLYWLTNNILSIAQQYVINKRLGVLGK
ncbi:membrane protein insertase YidC [Rhizobacter sp. Root404]|uniref:membrane protein insertase YidC n=1 Tax=Rhizobacter sp. Root404 TaxID=1736528 RepID=UPI0006F43CBE|nr:membrane protein insertase YidC [Rhizobacter sp. Root404]KQW35608.1 insertase [Rhizobacter sp. Root404]